MIKDKVKPNIYEKRFNTFKTVFRLNKYGLNHTLIFIEELLAEKKFNTFLTVEITKAIISQRKAISEIGEAAGDNK